MSSNDFADNAIQYDATFKTFFLYPGNSLYAFCISPELSLEHLYWGKKLPTGYDLRYLSQSTRMTQFKAEDSDSYARLAYNSNMKSLQEIIQRCRAQRVICKFAMGILRKSARSMEAKQEHKNTRS